VKSDKLQVTSESAGEAGVFSRSACSPLATDHLPLPLNALGSLPGVTQQAGGQYTDQLYYPWGQFWKYKVLKYSARFAGTMAVEPYANDTYPTPNRIYSGNYGRWLSPDPAGLAAASPSNPQSWNRYAYVGNNPTNFIDPTGLLEEVVCSGADGFANPDCPTQPPAWLSMDVFGRWFQCAFEDRCQQDRTPPVTVDPTPRPGSGGTADNAIARLGSAREDVSASPSLDDVFCQRDLIALGITLDQLGKGLMAANYANGTGSTVTSASLYAKSPNQTLARAGAGIKGTVGDQIATPGVVAVSQLGGNMTYINPSQVNKLTSTELEGLAMHEALHNVIGLTDSDFQRALGLPEGAPSVNIANKLIEDCLW
jgi:RHS repeat-associated protein